MVGQVDDRPPPFIWALSYYISPIESNARTIRLLGTLTISVTL